MQLLSSFFACSGIRGQDLEWRFDKEIARMLGDNSEIQRLMFKNPLQNLYNSINQSKTNLHYSRLVQLFEVC